MSVVLDSWVVGRWCFPGEASPGVDAALVEVAADEAVVPAVWWFEVPNLLLTGERVGRIHLLGTAAFLADLEGLSIKIDNVPVSDAVLACARTHRLTIHDAAYLELAGRMGVPLAPLDKPSERAARSAGVPLLAARVARASGGHHALERGADPDHPCRQPAAPARAGPALRAAGTG